MAVLAKKCPDCRVCVVDTNAARIRAWQSDRLPIYEPGLDSIVRDVLNRNLFFSTDIPGGIREADIIFVSVNTPTKTFGLGAGRAADLQHWERTARQILEHSISDKIVVEKSTLPVRTADALARILRSGQHPVHFEVLSNPEFLAEGTAVRDLENPDRVLIGGNDTPEGRRAVETLVQIYARWVPRERILTTNVWSSELSKLAANAFLAQRISSVNSLSALCELTEADVTEVAHAIGTDSRIGPRFLRAGPGFGGSCFRKDILNLVYLCEHYGLGEVAAYWRQVVAMNDYQSARFVERMVSAMFNTLAGKRIAIFGFAFKADTGDTRDSPAIRVARALVDEQAEVVITDPRALENTRLALHDIADRVTFESDPYRAAASAHALAILTEWESFRTLDYARIHGSMVRPAFVFDGRNLLDHPRLFGLGFNVYAVGKNPLTHLVSSSDGSG
jgi:UDPglucose 6-dehydrogenase